MRRFTLLLFVAAAATAGGAIVGASNGHVVRVEVAAPIDVRIPAGTFTMGLDEAQATDLVAECQGAFGRDKVRLVVPNGGNTYLMEDELCSQYATALSHLEAHAVYLDAYAIDRDEVTTREFRRCVAAGGCELTALITGDERYRRDDWPMVNVSWFDARDFCRWRGGRLPTEAEWEHAARGNDNRTWPWGNVDDLTNFNHGRARAPAMAAIDRDPGQPSDLGEPDDSDGTAILAPPGSYPWGEGPFGTRDQAGNVAEWTDDAVSDLGYEDLALANPHREGKTGDARVVRGGSWRQPAFIGRTFARDPLVNISQLQQPLLYLPERRFVHVGFRCARSL